MAIFNGWNIILDCLSVKNLLLMLPSRQNTLLKKCPFSWIVTPGALKCAYWLLVAVLIQSGYICPNSTKNRGNLGRLVRAVRFENELNSIRTVST